MNYTDVRIIGAGPSGILTALHLSYLEIKSIIIDKTFLKGDR
ncbi:FAD-dependent monooxygenase [Zobellia nedashkovskayae]